VLSLNGFFYSMFCKLHHICISLIGWHIGTNILHENLENNYFILIFNLISSSILFSWLNTTMMENRVTLNPTDLDDFDKVNASSF
jgi:hypothetical protein